MADWLIRNAWIVPALPLLGAIIVAIGGKWLREKSHWPVVLGIGLAFPVSVGLWLVGGDGSGRTVAYDWLEMAGLHVPILFRVDGLTTMMLCMVTFVATLVAIYASGYMHGDPGYPRFFALVGLFVFSMTGLVLSSDYVLTYAFWEGVGVCSYLLVGFYHSKPAAAAAAKKAFLVNRVGDFGFAVALFWLWTAISGLDLLGPGSSAPAELRRAVTQGGVLSYDVVLHPFVLEALAAQGAVLGIALLLFWAATAKSAQVPLYVWLPDAMEGPTPVSALIHAATMVTAGVYLIARSTPLLVHAPAAQITISAIGCITALLAALIALTQTDLKRVMAYSTISQLGYMFMAMGAGIREVAQYAVIAGMFHLFTHAFFKALLFLSSGSVMHSMGGVIDMRRFRGLRHRLPITHLTFLSGAIALSGLPIWAGFWSKDEILDALKLAGESSEAHGTGYTLIYWTAVFTALLTAFYTFRAYFLTFWGPEKLPSPSDPEADPHEDHGHGHGEIGHESPPAMTIPLIVLAICAALAGLVFGPTEIMADHLKLTPGLADLPHHEHAYDWTTAIVGSLAGLIGAAIAYLLYAKPSPIPGRMATALRPLWVASNRKFYVDEFYAATVVAFTTALAAISSFIDTYVIDGLVRLAAWLPRRIGRDSLSPLQNGLVQSYAAGTAIGVAVLVVILLLI